MKTKVVAGALAIPADEWNALADHDNPFVKHEFLALLERSKSVGPGTGWAPRFVCVYDDGLLVGAAPAYLRTDSYGEYVFDFGWAAAAERAGIRYYPKISVAVPFTPATGPRLLQRPGYEVRAQLVAGLNSLCNDERASGVHVLLCSNEDASFLSQTGYLQRATHQYHFHNRGYANYDAFLAELRSESRKQLRKERQKVHAIPGLTIERRRGDTLSADEWNTVNALYLETSSRKWGRPYLTDAFFTGARDTVGASALVCLARMHGEIVAMALSFERGTHVYGRYWGCNTDIDGLHFELCYHQLIDHALANGQTLVEAGAQGEHKIKRGFEPAIINSCHVLQHPGLHSAVARAVESEAAQLRAAIPEMERATPFRRG